MHSVSSDIVGLVESEYTLMSDETFDACWTPLFLELWSHAPRNTRVRERMQKVYAGWVDVIRRSIEALPSDAFNHTKISAVAVALLDGYNVQRTLELDYINIRDIIEVVIRLFDLAKVNSAVNSPGGCRTTCSKDPESERAADSQD